MKKFMKSGLMSLAVLGALAVTIPAAQAAPIVYNSSVGFCCFSVTLTDSTPTDVFVNVALTGGATEFANTGGGHIGFGFNLAGAAITSANIVGLTPVSPGWLPLNVGPFATNGPDYGSFGYYFNIDTSGTSGNVTALQFTVHRGTGIVPLDFTANASGYRFVADILNAQGTGMSAIPGTNTTVPEPISLSLVGGGLLALGLFRKRFAA